MLREGHTRKPSKAHQVLKFRLLLVGGKSQRLQVTPINASDQEGGFSSDVRRLLLAALTALPEEPGYYSLRNLMFPETPRRQSLKERPPKTSANPSAVHVVYDNIHF